MQCNRDNIVSEKSYELKPTPSGSEPHKKRDRPACEKKSPKSQKSSNSSSSSSSSANAGSSSNSHGNGSYANSEPASTIGVKRKPEQKDRNKSSPKKPKKSKKQFAPAAVLVQLLSILCS